MSKRSPFYVCSVFAALLAFPATAAAGVLDYFRWMDRLSGPGYFEGWGFEFTALCYGENDLNERKWQANFGCYELKRDRLPRVSVGFVFGRLKGDNPLPYPPPQDINKPEAKAMPILFSVDFGLDKLGFAEAGAGIGWVRFYGEGYSFNRFAIEPRVTVKPLVFFRRRAAERERRELEWLQGRLSFVAIPGSFEAADFGAIGPFQSESEFIGPSMTISIHAIPLINWLKN